MANGEALRLSDDNDTYLSAAEIQTRVGEMGAELSERYADVDEVRLVTVLNGAVPFARDLAACFDHPNVTTDAINIKSYDGTRSNGQPRIIKGLELPIEGEHVLLAEDIIDSGLSLVRLISYVKAHRPASVNVVSFLEKPLAREAGTEVDVEILTGIQIATKFVVGYGLDLDEDYRDLPHITTCHKVSPGIWQPRHLQEPVAA